MQQIWDNPCYILRVHRLELPRNDVFLSLEFFRWPQNCNAAFHLGPLCLWISSLQKTLMRYPFLFILSIKMLIF